MKLILQRLHNFVLVYEIPLCICLLAFFMQITISSNVFFVVWVPIFKRLTFRINGCISIEFMQLKCSPWRERRWFKSVLRCLCAYNCCSDDRCLCWPSVTNLIAYRDINSPLESNEVFLESVADIETSIVFWP